VCLNILTYRKISTISHTRR